MYNGPVISPKYGINEFIKAEEFVIMIDTTAPVQGSENTYINIHYTEIKSKLINMPSFVWGSTNI